MVFPLSFLVCVSIKWEVPKRIVHRNELSIRGKATIFLTIWMLCLLTSKSPNDIGHERILRKNWHKSPGFGGFCEQKDWYTLLSGKSENRMPALVNFMTRWREQTVQEAGSPTAFWGARRHELPWAMRMPLWVSRLDLHCGQRNKIKTSVERDRSKNRTCCVWANINSWTPDVTEYTDNQITAASNH